MRGELFYALQQILKIPLLEGRRATDIQNDNQKSLRKDYILVKNSGNCSILVHF